MKTHEIAHVLTILSRVLKSGPNIVVEDLVFKHGDQERPPMSNAEALVGLSTLTNLAKIDKRQWRSLVEENELPIDIRPRDASRDILGKVLKYLDSHPEVARKITTSANQSRGVSPQLTRALGILLNDEL